MEPGVGKWVAYLKRERKLDSVVGRRPTAPPAPKGLYIYGNVGTGIYLLLCKLSSSLRLYLGVGRKTEGKDFRGGDLN